MRLVIVIAFLLLKNDAPPAIAMRYILYNNQVPYFVSGPSTTPNPTPYLNLKTQMSTLTAILYFDEIDQKVKYLFINKIYYD